MHSVITKYLEYHSLAWSKTTLASERYRLNQVSRLGLTSPKEIYETLKAQGLKPYSLKTLMIRLVSLEKWAKAQSIDFDYGFEKFYTVHKNLFKHAYVKQELSVSFEQAKERIQMLQEPYRSAALSLLETGLRVSELASEKDGFVVGKGGKRRRVYGTIRTKVSSQMLRLKLKTVGLKPHMLRKLCATKLAEQGASAADLCEVFGWSSIETSYQYLQHRGVEKLRELVEKSTKAGEG